MEQQSVFKTRKKSSNHAIEAREDFGTINFCGVDFSETGKEVELKVKSSLGPTSKRLVIRRCHDLFLLLSSLNNMSRKGKALVINLDFILLCLLNDHVLYPIDY